MTKIETRKQTGSAQEKVEQIQTLDRLSFGNPDFRKESQQEHRKYERRLISNKEMQFLETATPEQFIEEMLRGYNPRTDHYNFIDENISPDQEQIEADEIESARKGNISGRRL